MKHIQKLSLKVFNEFETISETSIYQPLEADQLIDNNASPLSLPARKSRFKILTSKILKIFSPSPSVNKSSVFTTALALLITQPLWRNIILKTNSMRTKFVEITQQVANMYGLSLDSHDLELLEKDCERSSSLKALARKAHLLGEEQIKQVQCLLLDELQRPPITSSLTVSYSSGHTHLDLVTRYTKYKVHALEPTGRIIFQSQQNKGTCSIRTRTSIFPDTRGVIGQRQVWADQEKTLVGSYSGELNTTHHILEQILCTLQLTEQDVLIQNQAEASQDLCLLFTSLYAWTDFELICQQRESIQSLNNKYLQTQNGTYRLRLLYMNIPLNIWSRLPKPGETGAILQDLNDQSLIWLTYRVAQKLKLPLPPLEQWTKQLDNPYDDFFRAEHQRLAIIDAFRLYKMDLLPFLTTRKEPIALILHTLLSDRRPDGKKLRGMDTLLYLNELTKFLGIFHHKNSEQALHRSSAAKAADQAQFALTRLQKAPFLPGQSSEDEQHLFEVLYSLYLLKEEPELHQLMGTGESEHFQASLTRNPEIRRYLLV
ncbi:MAG: hypothetical protein JSS62_00760 [Verrucomicrobia bacterium]|nr:hypothetical protein [Verrucomicrobiota bacterium]MBS0645957.1 hypothetical protein [Verrucomicrobiota bacterium]